MKKSCKSKLYQFELNITKKAFLNFKNQYQSQKNKVQEKTQSRDLKQIDLSNKTSKKEEKLKSKQPEQMIKKNTICGSEFDNILLTTLNQLEIFLDQSEKEETPLILAKEEEQLSKDSQTSKKVDHNREQI